MSNWNNKKSNDKKIKSSLAYFNLRQPSLKDEFGERIPGTSKWFWEEEGEEEEEEEDEEYDDRKAIGEGKTIRLSSRRAVKPVRNEDISLGGWERGGVPYMGQLYRVRIPGQGPQLIIGPHGPGGPAAVAAARYNLDRGVYDLNMRVYDVPFFPSWSPWRERYQEATMGKNPLSEQIADVGRKRAHTSEIAKNIGRQNKNLRARRRTQRMGVASERTRTPTFLTDRIAQFEETPVSDLTKTGLGAQSQRKFHHRYYRRQKDAHHNGGKRKKNNKKTHEKTRRKPIKTRRKPIKTRRKSIKTRRKSIKTRRKL